ncbi:hypothetical protein V9Z70_07040 [Streptococcus suis]|uniref:hypothetical protein n=1 Tax=Streptococcus suis TaxID=1307 RepID=UPI0030105F5E
MLANKIAYMHRASLVYRISGNSMTQQADLATIYSTIPVAERLEVLSLIGFDISQEVKAFKWRSQINRDSKLKNGDIAAYRELEWRMRLLDKYRKD